MSREEAAAEEAYDALREDIIEEALKELAQDSVGSYMNRYGDAIEARIGECIDRARRLVAAGYFGPSFVSAGTAVELIIRYLILRPLVQGAFLSDHWAEILSNWVLSQRAAKDMKLLPAVLKHWNIDIAQVRLAGDKSLWQELHETIWPARNNHVHRGDPITQELALLGVEAAEVLEQTAVTALADAGARKLDDKWCHYGTPQDPFTRT